MSDDVCGTIKADEHEDQDRSHHKRSDVLAGTTTLPNTDGDLSPRLRLGKHTLRRG